MLFWAQPANKATYQLAKKARASLSTGSAASFDLALHWLEDCLLNHSKCNGSRTTRWYPTRLLDVSGENIRLTKTSAEPPDGPYATLSHCWGNKRFLVLTAENIPQFEAGIPINLIPRNFQDAITTTRRLRLRYIWIDCFCIIQSSISGGHEADKMLEISRMREVYANSILNIGASSAAHPDAGCFVDRERDVDMPVCFASHSSHVESDAQVFYLYHGEDALVNAAILDSSPIFSRAWILQERLLCPRMLHFGHDQLYWECPELLPGSEDFPCGQAPADKEMPFSISSDNLKGSERVTWCRAVTDYSSMNLSHPSEDKLVAIGGIAQQIAESVKDTYVAGLLRDGLISQLCWYSRVISRRPDNWRAPSWSWASVDGEVRFRFELMMDPVQTPMALIQKVNLKLMDPQNPCVPTWKSSFPGTS